MSVAGRYLAVGDAYYDFCLAPVVKFPSATEDTLIVPRFESRPAGGLGYLALALAAGIGFSELRLMANVGDQGDPLSTDWVGSIAAAGVDVSLVSRVAGSSIGACVAFVSPDGERSFLAAYGANSAPMDLSEGRLEGVDSLLVAGFCHTPGLWGDETAAALLAFKSKPRSFVMLDPGWDPDPEASRSLLKVLPMVDILFPNRSEICSYSGESDPVSAASIMSRLFHLTVVLKVDREGCIVATNSQVLRFRPASTVPAVDTTGAGDFFLAGFFAEYVRSNGDLARSARFANTVAAASIQSWPFSEKIQAVKNVVHRVQE